MQTVLADVRRHGRPPRDERTAAVRRADRSFFVLVPEQRPSEHGTPEVADLWRTVACDRSQTTTTGEEPVARLDHAELVAFRIGEHDVLVGGPFTPLEGVCARFGRAVGPLPFVVHGRG